MAADVSFFMRIINGGDMNKSSVSGGKSTVGLVTRDLLGGCLDSKELDLDLQVPCGWEKKLDLQSGKVFFQRCNSPNSCPSTTSEQKQPNNQAVAKFQDLNCPPALKQPLNLFDDASLELKLVPSSASASASSPPSCSNFQSVCTLDKVKSALERAEKETVVRKRSMSMSMSMSMSKASSPSSNSSSSIKDSEIDREDDSSASFLTGCPSCLLYVLISKSNPKCPRCNTVVPSPLAVKKPRIDLNISI